MGGGEHVEGVGGGGHAGEQLWVDGLVGVADSAL